MIAGPVPVGSLPSFVWFTGHLFPSAGLLYLALRPVASDRNLISSRQSGVSLQRFFHIIHNSCFCACQCICPYNQGTYLQGWIVCVYNISSSHCSPHLSTLLAFAVLYVPAVLHSQYRWLTRYVYGALQCTLASSVRKDPKESHRAGWLRLEGRWDLVVVFLPAQETGLGSVVIFGLPSFQPTFSRSVQFGLVLLTCHTVLFPLQGLIWPAIKQSTSSVQDSSVSGVFSLEPGKMVWP